MSMQSHALADTCAYWDEWLDVLRVPGPLRGAVYRSLMVLKAMTYSPTGGLVAAPTTSLPEQIGGVRNWDYRYCWLRDASFALAALVDNGFVEEARRLAELAPPGGRRRSRRSPDHVRAGRRAPARPSSSSRGSPATRARSRSGSATARASSSSSTSTARCSTCSTRRAARGLAARRATRGRSVGHLLGNLEQRWREPDEGIWEVRGRTRQFTHSKVMAWVAFDRGIRLIEELGRDGPLERWRAVRDEIHAEVLEQGYDARARLVRAVLRVAPARCEPAHDPALRLPPAGGSACPRHARGGATGALRRRLRAALPPRSGGASVDGLPPGEGAFFLCSFWFVDNLVLLGELDEAREMFERLLALRNELGLLSEEYDPKLGRLVGNFPQAFSHIGLVNTAMRLERALSDVG